MATEQSHNALQQIKKTFTELSLGKKITLGIVVAATLGFFAYVMSWAGKSEYQTLYGELNLEDAGAIVQQLKADKIPYQLAANGSAVLVPKELVHETRLALASRGLPQGGSAVGFEIFDNAKLGLTEFAQNVNYQRALQGELSRTINRFEEIESSRVHLVMVRRSLFVEKEEPASASVVIKLKAGRQLAKTQIQAVVHLVSSSIPGLSPEHVTVVDNHGGLLAGQSEKMATSGVSADQLEYQQQVERSLENRTKSMLESVLGPGRAVVQVSCALDFTRQEKTEELYDPNQKVVRSEKQLSELSSPTANTASGVPGALSNLPDTPPMPAAAASTGSTTGPVYQKQDRTMNYEIGKVTSRKVMAVGSLQRLSVAVMVDGTYQRVAGADGKSEIKYQERSPEEMTKLENIVKRAVNFDANRGDEVVVSNLPFETEQVAENQTALDGWLAKLRPFGTAIRYGLAALFVLLTFLFLVRPLVRWLTTGPEVEMLKQLPMTVGELEQQAAGGAAVAQLPSPQPINQIVLQDQDKSIKLIKQWLKEA